jgi:hypothetical protein
MKCQMLHVDAVSSDNGQPSRQNYEAQRVATPDGQHYWRVKLGVTSLPGSV